MITDNDKYIQLSYPYGNFCQNRNSDISLLIMSMLSLSIFLQKLQHLN